MWSRWWSQWPPCCKVEWSWEAALWNRINAHVQTLESQTMAGNVQNKYFYREPQFTQLVDPKCNSLHWVGTWSVLPNLSCAIQIIWHLAKIKGRVWFCRSNVGLGVCISVMPMLPVHESYFSNNGLNDLKRHFWDLGFFDLCLFIKFGIWVLW